MATNREQQQEKIETEHTEHSIKYDPESATSLSDPEKNSNKIQEPFVKSPEEKKLVRKITFTLMPFIAFVCMLQVADNKLS